MYVDEETISQSEPKTKLRLNTRSEKSVIVSIIFLAFMNESACIIQYNNDAL